MKNKLYICKDYHIQPSEIMMLPYYEYEIILEEIKSINKQQEKDNERQQKEFDAMQHKYNPNNMMKGVTNSMGNMGNLSMPKVTIPKL